MYQELVHAALGVAHVGAAATWLGAMVYSLGVVQPRAQRFLGTAERYESFAVELGGGARWKVLGLCGALAASGAGLAAMEISGASSPSRLWVALIVAKAVLLAVAVGLFAYVSWWLWPARIFAAPDELVAVQRRFRVVALLLTAVVAAGLVLGAVADSIA